MKRTHFACIGTALLVAIGSSSPAFASPALRQTVTDASLPASERVAALETLADSDPLAAEDVAVALVSDQDTAVAVAAVAIVAEAIVMSDHPVVEPERLSPRLREVMERHHSSRVALYPVLEDPRPAVRSLAARTLTALGDERALGTIQSGTATGLYTETEAANYFGLAGARAGGPYLSAYLDEGAETARETAVQYLGRSPLYQRDVRNRVLLDAAEAPAVRAQAARVLGTYDAEFTSYAGELVESTELPAEVYTEIVERYLDKRPSVSPQEIDGIRRSMDVYLEREIDTERLRRLEDRVEEFSLP